MEIIDQLKEMDPEQLRKYIVIGILIVAIIIFRDMFIGIINVFLSLAGVGPIGTGGLPPGFMFFLFAVLFFGFALVFVMILQKKKLARKAPKKKKNIIPKGFCDICEEPNARNLLKMKYNEDESSSFIYVCERCRDDIKEMRHDNRNQS